jgi:hypothetical protein
MTGERENVDVLFRLRKKKSFLSFLASLGMTKGWAAFSAGCVVGVGDMFCAWSVEILFTIPGNAQTWRGFNPEK